MGRAVGGGGGGEIKGGGFVRLQRGKLHQEHIYGKTSKKKSTDDPRKKKKKKKKKIDLFPLSLSSKMPDDAVERSKTTRVNRLGSSAERTVRIGGPVFAVATASCVYLFGVLYLSTRVSSASCRSSNAWLGAFGLSVMQCVSWMWFLELKKRDKPRAWYRTAVECWAFWLAVDLSPGCSAEEYLPGYILALELLLGFGTHLLRYSCVLLGIRIPVKAEAAFYAATAFVSNSIGRPEYSYGAALVALVAATKAVMYARMRAPGGPKRPSGSNEDDTLLAWGSFLPHCTIVSVFPCAAIRFSQTWARRNKEVGGGGRDPILPVHLPRRDSGVQTERSDNYKKEKARTSSEGREKRIGTLQGTPRNLSDTELRSVFASHYP